MLSHPESRDRRHIHGGDLPFSTKFDRGLEDDQPMITPTTQSPKLSARTGFSGMDRLSRKLEKDALKWVSATTPLHFDRTEKNRLHAGLPRSDIKVRSNHSTEDTVTSSGSGFGCRNTMKNPASLTVDGSALSGSIKSRSSGSNWASAASDDFYHLTEKYIHGGTLTANLRSHGSAAASAAATSSSANNKSANHILEGTRWSDDGSRPNNNIDDDLVNQRETKENEIGGSRSSSGEGEITVVGGVSPSGAPPSPTEKKSPIRGEEDHDEDEADKGGEKAQNEEDEAREKADKEGEKEIDWVKAWDLLRRENHSAIPGTEWKLLKESFLCLLKQNADKEEENVNMRGQVERILQASVDQLGLLEQKVTKQVSEWRKEMVKFLAAKDNQIESLRVREVEASRQIYQLSAQLSTINHSKRRTSSPKPHPHANAGQRANGNSQIANGNSQIANGNSNGGLEYNNSPSPGSRLTPKERLRHLATPHLCYSSHNLLQLSPLTNPHLLPNEVPPANHNDHHHHLSRTSPIRSPLEGTHLSPPRSSILSPAHSFRPIRGHDEIHLHHQPAASATATSPCGSSPKPFLTAGSGKTSSGRHRPTLHGKHNLSSGKSHHQHHHGPSSEQNNGSSGAEIHHHHHGGMNHNGSSGARSMSSGAVKKNERRTYDSGNNTRGSTDGRDRKGSGDGVSHGSHGPEGRRHGTSSSQRRRFEYDEALRKSKEQDKKKEKGCGIVVSAGSGGRGGGAYASGSISRPPSMPPPTMMPGNNTVVNNGGGGFLTTTPLACSFSPTALCGAYNVHPRLQVEGRTDNAGHNGGVFKTYVTSPPATGRRQEMEQQQQQNTTIPSSPVDSTRLNPLASARTYASGYTSLHSARTQVAYGPPPGTGMSPGSPTFLSGPGLEESGFKRRTLSVDAPALNERRSGHAKGAMYTRFTHFNNSFALPPGTEAELRARTTRVQAEAEAGAGSSSAAARAHTVSPPRTMHITPIGSTLCPPCNITRSPLLTPRTVNIGVFPCWNTTPKLHSREINISSPFLPQQSSPPPAPMPHTNTEDMHGMTLTNNHGTNGNGPTSLDNHLPHTNHGKGGSSVTVTAGNFAHVANGNFVTAGHVPNNRIAIGMPNRTAHAGGPPRTNNNRPGCSYGSRSASTGRLQF